MSVFDWLTLFATLIFVIIYGIYRGRGEKNLNHYFKSNNNLPWFLVLLSIMGTQASAITFLSGPGQSYTDGMRFVQYYFGLPFAMLVLAFTFIPIYKKLKVFTAYEYLEHRFDLKTRVLTAIIFLLQRGLSTGISIYAPSIILSSLLGWNIYLTNVLIGGLLIIYTTTGGARAVAYTQQQQLLVVLVGMFFTTYIMVQLLPETLNLWRTIKVADTLGKLNFIVTDFAPTDAEWWKDKYNLWSGLIGGFFLALSYFGTDQSQVSRYLTSKSVRECRKSLLMNGIVKVPMQFLILLIGGILFVFYLHFQAPINFNYSLVQKALQTENKNIVEKNIVDFNELQGKKKIALGRLSHSIENEDKDGIDNEKKIIKQLDQETQDLKTRNNAILKQSVVGADTNDTNYIFFYFFLNNLPVGLVGLMIAMVFLASWGSISAAINSLSSCTIIDIFKRLGKGDSGKKQDYKYSQITTILWGVFSVAIAMFASNLGSLIEAVNVLGSLFYGVMLGIFLVAFYMKTIKSNAVFYSALLVEVLIIIIYFSNIVSFLWLNVIGALGVALLAYPIQLIIRGVRRGA